MVIGKKNAAKAFPVTGCHRIVMYTERNGTITFEEAAGRIGVVSDVKGTD